MRYDIFTGVRSHQISIIAYIYSLIRESSYSRALKEFKTDDVTWWVKNYLPSFNNFPTDKTLLDSHDYIIIFMEKVQTILVPAVQTITVSTRIAIYAQLRSKQPNSLRILRFGGSPTNRVTPAEVLWIPG